MKVFLLEVTATIDDDEDVKGKEKEIKEAIQSLDPSIAVFEVQNCQEE